MKSLAEHLRSISSGSFACGFVSFFVASLVLLSLASLAFSSRSTLSSSSLVFSSRHSTSSQTSQSLIRPTSSSSNTLLLSNNSLPLCVWRTMRTTKSFPGHSSEVRSDRVENPLEKFILGYSFLSVERNRWNSLWTRLSISI